MLQEFYRCADKVIFLETALEAVHAGKSTLTETPHETALVGKSTPAEKGGENKKRENGDLRWSLEANNKKARSPNQRVPRPRPRKYTNFIDLTSSLEEVFLAIEQKGVYKRSDPLLQKKPE